MSSSLILFLLGAGAFIGGGLWLGLVVFPRRAASIEQLLAYARDRGFLVQGDGLDSPLRLVRALPGGRRICTITFQLDNKGGDTLVIGVDCATSAAGTSPALTDLPAQAHDAALVARWTRPDPSLTTASRLDQIIAALEEAALTLEAQAPAAPDPAEPDPAEPDPAWPARHDPIEAEPSG